MRFFLILAALSLFSILNAQTAKEIIQKADELAKGESSEAEMTMKIVRPKWERTVTFKSWGKGMEFSLTLITSPAKESGQTFLKRGNDLWSWNPTIGRMIKLPPAMMSQGWMGSDYSNDDILKESSIVVDYDHELSGSEVIEGKDCYKIEMKPKEDAAVVWSKVIKWITKDGYMQLRSEYYDEDDELVKTDRASKIKVMDGREIPTYVEIIPVDKPGNKTIVEINSLKFNLDIKEDFFSQQNMKRVR